MERLGYNWREEGGGMESENAKQRSSVENPVNSKRREKWTRIN
jgi:hypothetical protein